MRNVVLTSNVSSELNNSSKQAPKRTLASTSNGDTDSDPISMVNRSTTSNNNNTQHAKKQKTLFQFNSMNPSSENIPLFSLDDDFSGSWTKVVAKNTKSAKSEKAFNNMNNLKSSQTKQVNQPKSTKTPIKPNNRNSKWLKSVGQSITSDFKVAPRPFQVYLGRIDNSMSEKDVVNLLNSLEIKFFDLKQIKTTHNNFKSFNFSINFLDRDIIKRKDIWPRGLVVNRLITKKNSTSSTQSDN